jgi:hypothetical protein
MATTTALTQTTRSRSIQQGQSKVDECIKVVLRP